MRLGPGDLVEFQVARCTAPLDGDGNGSGPSSSCSSARSAGPWRSPASRPPTGRGCRRCRSSCATSTSRARSVSSTSPRSSGARRCDGIGRAGTSPCSVRWARARRPRCGRSCRSATSVDPPNRLHVYVVDTKGDTSLDALAGAHCPDVIRLHEVERVDRLVRRLATELDRRRSESAADRGPDIVVAIDGLTALRESLEHVERGSSLAELDRVLADGPAVGIATIAVLDASTRWWHRAGTVRPTLGVPPRRPQRCADARRGVRPRATGDPRPARRRGLRARGTGRAARTRSAPR